jgi:dolichol kinase
MDRTQLITGGSLAFIFFYVCFTTYYACGKLVEWFHAKVAYTRKLIHFVTFALPWTLQQAFGLQSNLRVAVIASFLVPLHFFIFVEPIRRRSRIVSTMFRSFDRPEDRPHTLWWIITQFAATYSVYAALYGALIYRDATEWMIIPLLIMAIGDGLAEPVGVRFGKHPYATTSLDGKRSYRRTWEGSACVFVTGIIVVLCLTHWFTMPQLIAALLVIPISGTLLEAKAPHTWDQPVMLLGMGVELLAISYL